MIGINIIYHPSTTLLYTMFSLIMVMIDVSKLIYQAYFVGFILI